MLIYRIALAEFSGKLITSGNAARWNSKDVKMIYTASSRSLACLENVVHRSRFGLNQFFNVMVIDCPDSVDIKTISLNNLPADWIDFNQMHVTQQIGDEWIKKQESVVMKVPSSIIEEEFNYLLNPEHPDFEKVKLVKTAPFVFDQRIKL
jgi:RES domain-containing protein